MTTYATATHIGGRSHQCDATAVRTNPTRGTRAYAVLDGIGSSDSVQAFTRSAAARLARSASLHGDAETALRKLQVRIAAEPERADTWNDLPSAAAIVAVYRPDRVVTIAWAGDCRAYHLTDAGAVCLSRDHNLRRTVEEHGLPAGFSNRNVITSYLGGPADDAEAQKAGGHPAVEAAEMTSHGRLLLASDGAYEPLEDSGVSLASYATGTPKQAARRLVTSAVSRSGGTSDNATCLIVDL